MALSLSYSVTEQGDNKLITVTDTTGVYDAGTNPTGWGAPNTALSAIGTGNLTLTISITTSDGTTTVYDAIDLHAILAAHAATTDLVYEIDCSMLIDPDDDALGTDEDVFPDGLYEITYSWTGTTPTHTDSHVLIDGVVKSAIYALLRTIPTKYECEDYHERDVLDIIFMKGYYDAMIATAVVGREDQVIDQLLVLERLVADGSNYTW